MLLSIQVLLDLGFCYVLSEIWLEKKEQKAILLQKNTLCKHGSQSRGNPGISRHRN